MRAIILVCFVMTLLGCVTRRIILVNNQGDELTCEVMGYGAVGVLGMSHKSDECVLDAEKRGYRLKEQKN